MGLYDHLKINPSKLGVTDKEAKKLNKAIWITKDLFNHMGYAEITEEGYLVFNEAWQLTYAGEFRIIFYESGGDDNWEFEAVFIDGKLSEIIRIQS